VRILLVSEDLPGEQIGGLGKHVVTLGNALLARGHAVRILGRSDRGCAGGKGAAAADPARQIGFLGSFVPGFDYAHPGWKESQLGIFNPLKRPYFARKIGTAINRHAADADVVHYHGHLPMVGLHVAPGMNYVQTRHDQGSECLTHLRFRRATVRPASARVPVRCANRSRPSPSTVTVKTMHAPLPCTRPCSCRTSCAGNSCAPCRMPTWRAAA
jgi:glycogen synthase